MTLMIDDRDLEKGPELPLGPPTHGGAPLKPVAIIGALIVLLIAGAAWWMSRRTPPAANATPRAVTATDAPIDSVREQPSRPLPPLAEMDSFLRPLLSALSSRPELARWLATDNLVRQLAVAIDQAAAGGTPAQNFKVIAPETPFATRGSGSQRSIDPASYQRYDGLVSTVTSIEARKVAEVYRTIQPRLNEAYRGLGHPEGDVDRALTNALDILIDTPIVQGPMRIHAIDARGWIYVDPDLEALTASQKQLLRMGPAHAAAVVNWLRAFRTALQ